MELTPGRRGISLYDRDMVFGPDLGHEQIVQSRPFTVTLIAQPGVNDHLVADDSGLVVKGRPRDATGLYELNCGAVDSPGTFRVSGGGEDARADDQEMMPSSSRLCSIRKS